MNMVVKPVDAIHNLIAHLSHAGRYPLALQKKNKIEFDYNGKNNIFFLTEGSVGIHRCSDEKIVITIEAPAVIGLTRVFGCEGYHYLSTLNEMVMIHPVSAETALAVIEKDGLWRDVSEILAYVTNLYYYRDENVFAPSAYDIVRAHIEMLWELPASVRLKTSAFDYIMSRNIISRSTLNKIFRELEKGGYITLSRGILLDMKSLPKQY